MMLLSPFYHDKQGGDVNDIATESGSSDASSDTSSTSLTSAPGKGSKCYLLGSTLKVPGGALICVEDLLTDSIVCSPAGTLLNVTHLTIHPEEPCELVDLNTANASLVVTTSHRVMVRKGKQSQTMTAGSLRVGDHVLLAGNETEELVQVEKFTRVSSVVEVTFLPGGRFLLST